MDTLKKFLEDNLAEDYEIKAEYGSQSTLMGVETTVYPLKENVIRAVVPANILYGNYRKGRLSGTYFDVLYVGRTGKGKGDKHTLQERLIEHARKHTNEDLYFDFNAAKTIEDAYKQECMDYHFFNGGKPCPHLTNMNHPAMPDGENIDCPFPNCSANQKGH